MKPRNRRLTTLWFVGGAALFLLAVTVAGLLLEERAMETDFSRQNLAPSLAAPFGTDWMGRDMLARTLAGLSVEHPHWAAHRRCQRRGGLGTGHSVRRVWRLGGRLHLLVD